MFIQQVVNATNIESIKQLHIFFIWRPFYTVFWIPLLHMCVQYPNLERIKTIFHVIKLVGKVGRIN